MKKIILFLTIALVAVTVYAQNNDGSDIPANLKAVFNQTYPSAKGQSWIKLSKGYLSVFNISGTPVSVNYDLNGKLVEERKTIQEDGLVQASRDYLAKTFPTLKVTRVNEVKNTESITTYEVILSDDDTYIFDASGNFLKKVEDEDGY